MELAEKASELIPAKDVEELGCTLGSVTRSRFLGLHHKVKQKYAYLESIIDYIQKLTREGLQELSECNMLEEVLKMKDLEKAEGTSSQKHAGEK